MGNNLAFAFLGRVLKAESEKPKIHVFFMIKADNPGSFKILGDEASSADTKGAIAQVPGLFDLISFPKYDSPEGLMVHIESFDKKTQSRFHKKNALNIFCLAQHRDAIVECLSLVKDCYTRDLVLHVGDDKVGWATFADEGYACEPYYK